MNSTIRVLPSAALSVLRQVALRENIFFLFVVFLHTLPLLPLKFFPTLNKYEQHTGRQIDYVTRWYYNSAINDSCTKSLNRSLETDYIKVWTSATGKAEVFRKNANE